MALSNTEANAVNAVTRYFLNIGGHAGPVSAERALAALLLLREKAYKTLSAGLRDGEVVAAFRASVGTKAAVRKHNFVRDGSTTFNSPQGVPYSLRQQAHCSECGLHLTVRASPATVEEFLTTASQAPCDRGEDGETEGG